MTDSSQDNDAIVMLSEAHVAYYLKNHPEFFANHPELMEGMDVPARKLGAGVVDFQHFQVKNLQSSSKELKEKYRGLVDFCRDNLHNQAQIHEAVLRLMQCRSLEQILEIITVDLANLLSLDIVKLALESEMAEAFHSGQGDQQLAHLYDSGIVPISRGMVEMSTGGQAIQLVENSAGGMCAGFDEIFIHARSLTLSYALITLNLEQIDQPALLALGVREEDRFVPGQSTELLSFLGAVLSLQLDKYMVELS